jgi:hypothetical protein
MELQLAQASIVDISAISTSQDDKCYITLSLNNPARLRATSRSGQSYNNHVIIMIDVNADIVSSGSGGYGGAKSPPAVSPILMSIAMQNLEIVKRSVLQIVDQLHPADILTLIVYDEYAYVVCEGYHIFDRTDVAAHSSRTKRYPPVDTAHNCISPDDLVALICKIQCDDDHIPNKDVGITNLWQALTDAFACKLKYQDEFNTSIVLYAHSLPFSADAEVDVQQFLSKFEEVRQQDAVHTGYTFNCTITTIGIGKYVNGGLLSTIAEMGGGMYYYIPLNSQGVSVQVIDMLSVNMYEAVLRTAVVGGGVLQRTLGVDCPQSAAAAPIAYCGCLKYGLLNMYQVPDTSVEFVQNWRPPRRITIHEYPPASSYIPRNTGIMGGRLSSRMGPPHPVLFEERCRLIMVESLRKLVLTGDYEAAIALFDPIALMKFRIENKRGMNTILQFMRNQSISITGAPQGGTEIITPYIAAMIFDMENIILVASDPENFMEWGCNYIKSFLMAHERKVRYSCDNRSTEYYQSYQSYHYE